MGSQFWRGYGIIVNDSKFPRFYCIKIKLAFFALLLGFLTACATPHYINSDSGANWRQNSAQCEAYVISQTSSAFGDLFAKEKSAFNNLGQSIGSLARHDRLYELCLQSRSWHESV